MAQKIRDDEIIELIYKRLPNHMKSNLKYMNDFNINNTDMMQFCKVLECLELSYQLEKKPEKSKKLEALKKDSEKCNGKHSGKKHTNTTNELLPVSTKKPSCLLHGTHSHTTDECEVMKEQAERMKVTWHKLPPSMPRKIENGKPRRLPLTMKLTKWWLKVSRSL